MACRGAAAARLHSRMGIDTTYEVRSQNDFDLKLLAFQVMHVLTALPSLDVISGCSHKPRIGGSGERPNIFGHRRGGGSLTGALKLKCNAIAAAASAISGIIVMVVISNVKGRRSRPL